MLSERESLRRAILVDPTDKVARLVYADWLEEHGATHEVNYAKFIRAQYRGEKGECDARQAKQWFGAEWLSPFHFNRTKNSLGIFRLGPQASGGGDVILRTEGFRVVGGFVRELYVAKVADFAQLAPRMFLEHPVEYVFFRDRSIDRTLVDATDGVCDDQSCRLPRDLFALLEGGSYDRGNNGRCPTRKYASHVEAKRALSEAAVRYGRNKRDEAWAKEA